jgi:hypothetical protein
MTSSRHMFKLSYSSQAKSLGKWALFHSNLSNPQDIMLPDENVAFQMSLLKSNLRSQA